MLHKNSKELSKNIRLNAVRMVNRGGSSHIGSVLSIADILAVLYHDILNIDPNDPCKDDRDRFILSKGHAGAAVYAVLAESGFFPVSRLETHYQDGSDLSGHVSHKNVSGVELSTGSLGHGLSVGAPGGTEITDDISYLSQDAYNERWEKYAVSDKNPIYEATR